MVFRLVIVGVLSAVAFILWAVTAPSATVSPLIPPATEQEADRYVVTRVLDGDTIVVNGDTKVRYIGIDSPEFYGQDTNENECFAAEAKQRNEQFVLGRTVVLEKDTTDTDEYDRLLRYVYIDDPLSSVHEATSINEILVHEGYAFARAFPPDTAMQKNLSELEQDAKQNNRGLWEECR